jgi:hypothetical protein
MRAKASAGFIAGTMSDRYISVVRRAMSFSAYSLVDLLAQVAQADALVARVLLARTPAAPATAAGCLS